MDGPIVNCKVVAGTTEKPMPLEKGDLVILVRIDLVRALRDAYKGIPERGIVPKDVAAWVQPLINACTAIVGVPNIDRVLEAVATDTDEDKPT